VLEFRGLGDLTLIIQVFLLRPFLAFKAFRDRLLADDGFMNKAMSLPCFSYKSLASCAGYSCKLVESALANA
jgi:hypothetical protein